MAPPPPSRRRRRRRRRARGRLRARRRPSTCEASVTTMLHAFVASSTLFENLVESSASSIRLALNSSFVVERDARQLHRLQAAREDPHLRLVEAGAAAVDDLLDGAEDGGRLAELARGLHHLGLHLHVRRAQLIRVGDAHQVADDAPECRRRLDRSSASDVGVRDVRLRRRERALERGELAVEALQQLLDRRRHVLRHAVSNRGSNPAAAAGCRGGGGPRRRAEAGGHARRWAGAARATWRGS